MTVNSDVKMLLGKFDTIVEPGCKWRGKALAIVQPGEEAVIAEQMTCHKNGVMFIKAKTNTEWFQNAVAVADAVLLVKGKLPLIDENGGTVFTGSGMAVIAFGLHFASKLIRAEELGVLEGKIILEWKRK